MCFKIYTNVPLVYTKYNGNTHFCLVYHNKIPRKFLNISSNSYQSHETGLTWLSGVFAETCDKGHPFFCSPVKKRHQYFRISTKKVTNFQKPTPRLKFCLWACEGCNSQTQNKTWYFNEYPCIPFISRQC